MLCAERRTCVIVILITLVLAGIASLAWGIWEVTAEVQQQQGEDETSQQELPQKNTWQTNETKFAIALTLWFVALYVVRKEHVPGTLSRKVFFAVGMLLFHTPLVVIATLTQQQEQQQQVWTHASFGLACAVAAALFLERFRRAFDGCAQPQNGGPQQRRPGYIRDLCVVVVLAVFFKFTLGLVLLGLSKMLYNFPGGGMPSAVIILALFNLFMGYIVCIEMDSGYHDSCPPTDSPLLGKLDDDEEEDNVRQKAEATISVV